MKTNAKIEKTEQGLRVTRRANARVRVSEQGLVIESAKITYNTLAGSVFNYSELLAA